MEARCALTKLRLKCKELLCQQKQYVPFFFWWVECDQVEGEIWLVHCQRDCERSNLTKNFNFDKVWFFHFRFFCIFLERRVLFDLNQVIQGHPPTFLLKCHGTNAAWLITFWDDATFASLCLFVSGRSWWEGQLARDLKINKSAVTRSRDGRWITRHDKKKKKKKPPPPLFICRSWNVYV